MKGLPDDKVLGILFSPGFEIYIKRGYAFFNTLCSNKKSIEYNGEVIFESECEHDTLLSEAKKHYRKIKIKRILG